MFRRSPRAALLAAGAVVLAVTTSVLVASSLVSLRRQDAAYGALHPVLVARRDLPLGARVGRADVAVRRIRGEDLQPAALRAAPAAVGRTVRVPLLAGTPLTARHLAAADRGALAAVVPAGRRAVRLVVEHGLRPRPGDLVDVLATFDPATLGDAGDPTVVVAAAVPVAAVEPAGADTGADTVAVTVVVEPRQASRLAFSAAAGTVSLALAPPEAARGG